MKVPTAEIAANLRWTRDGRVWADWILSGQPYALTTPETKEGARAMHQALFRSLPGDSLLLGMRADTDPASVVARMMEGVDLSACPDWVGECQATWDSLEALQLGRRVYWLSVPLATHGLGWVTGVAHARMRDLRDVLGLPRAQLGAEEIARVADQATRIAEGLPAVFAPTPATPAQMVWLHEHQLYRGQVGEDLPDPSDARTEALTAAAAGQGWHRGSALPEPHLDEGASADLPGAAARIALLGRRFLKVSDASAPGPATATYQAMLVVRDTPEGGGVFPGGELLGRVDECGLDVDWGIRLRVLTSAQAIRLNRGVQRKVNDQYHQRDSDGLGMSTLDRLAADMVEYAQMMEGDSLEVETQATIIFAVSATTPDIVRQHATHLGAWVSQAGYKTAQPLGYQGELWWALHPGTPTTAVITQYAQIAPAKNLACLVPLVSTEAGDPKGIRLGLNITHGPLTGPNEAPGSTGVVLYDPEGASDRQTSGSIAFAGALGAGKTTALMVIAGGILDMGGDLIITDKTEVGEWARWAQDLTTVAVIDPTAPTFSLDPIRLFGIQDGVPILRNFLVALLGLDRASNARHAMAEILTPAYLARHHLTTTGRLLGHLQAGECTISDADALTRMLRGFAPRADSRVIFDDEVPAVALDQQRALVIRTHSMALPSDQDLQQAHLFGQLSDDKVFGRAFHSLIAGIARKMCFANSAHLSGFVVSEAKALTASPEAAAELATMVAEGRKYRVVVALDCHDPLLAFDATMQSLIPYRVLMRTGDEALARRGLEWLGADPHDPQLLAQVMALSPRLGQDGRCPEHRAGEGLIRDAHGRPAVMKVLFPANPARAQVLRQAGSARTRLDKKPAP